MNRACRRWWFLNPIEWLKAIYEAFGVKYPTGSLIAVIILSATAGAAVWILAANLVAKDHPKKTDESPHQGESPEHENLSVQAQVYFPYASPALTIRWNGPGVFVELTTDIIDASPFDLVATGIDGRLKWDGIEFQRSVELAGDTRLVRNGGRVTLTIRQPIGKEEAAKLQAQKSVVFSPEPLLLYLAYTDRYGKSKNFTKQIPWESVFAWHF